MALVEASGVRLDRDLLTEMVANCVRIARDSPDRGDIKIVNTALRELRASNDVFIPHRHRRKVSIFGSARTAPTDPAYAAARETGRMLAAHGWMIITGAGPGIMRAGVEGAGAENSFGVSIRLPFESADAQTIIAPERMVRFRYFFTRKLTFMKESSAYVVFPGGFGTLDETFELLTLMQTGKEPPAPVVLFDPPGVTYWRTWREFIAHELVPRGLVSPEDLGFVTVTSSVDEAAATIETFYANFHSMRWVDGLLVLRLLRPLSDAALAELNREFADICAQGRIEPIGPLQAELDDGDAVELPRVSLHFDNRQFARLHQLVRALGA